MIGDVTGNVIPYLLDSKKIMSQITLGEEAAAEYGLTSATNNFSKFSKLAGTVGKRTVLGRVAAVAQRAANFGRAALEQLNMELQL